MNNSLIRDFTALHKVLAKQNRMPYVLAQSGFPMILPSSGTIGNNGALSGLTALPTTYAQCYMYFPANAIAAGVAAGLYYVVMSSTTAGTIYNNTYTGGVPEAPASPTAFVTTGPGAYTQTTGADVTLVSISLPGGSLGNNGAFSVKGLCSLTNNADAKTLRCKFGGTNVISTSVVSTAAWSIDKTIRNRGVQTSQVCASTNLSSDSVGSMGSNATSFTAIDSSAASTIVISGQLVSVATNNFILELFEIQVKPS